MVESHRRRPPLESAPRPARARKRGSAATERERFDAHAWFTAYLSSHRGPTSDALRGVPFN